MKPVHQRYGSDSSKLEFGDCLRACIASILELSLDDGPHFRWGANEDRPDTVQSCGASPRLPDAPAADWKGLMSHSMDLMEMGQAQPTLRPAWMRNIPTAQVHRPRRPIGLLLNW